MTGKKSLVCFIVCKAYISKKIPLNKHSSLDNGTLAEILMELHTDVCNLPQNAPRNESMY